MKIISEKYEDNHSHILHVLVISLVEPFPLLGDSIGKTAAMIPNLKTTFTFVCSDKIKILTSISAPFQWIFSVFVIVIDCVFLLVR